MHCNKKNGLIMPKTILSLIAFISLFLPCRGRPQGTLYVSNLEKTPTMTAPIGTDSWIAQSFSILTTDPNAYILNSIQLSMAPSFGSPADFTVSIYSAPFGSGGSPGDHYVGTLSGSSNPEGAGLYTYAASGISVSSSEFYWVVVTSGTPIAQGAYNWTAVVGGTRNGNWGITDGYSTSSDGTSWTGHLRQGAFQMAINATPIPEPATWVLAGLGLSLLVIRRCQTRRSTRF